MPPSRSDALAGITVALLESRLGREMEELVRRQGGAPRLVPAVRETSIDCRASVASFLRMLESPGARVIVFLTGVGVNLLFEEAERQGRLAFLLDSLSRATLVCRGPKPSAALKRRGLRPSACAREPFTSVEVLEALDECGVSDVPVVLVHYGERSESLATAMGARGARLTELCLYEWQLPEDTRPMARLIDDIIAGRIAAVVFTTQIQARHLLQVAAAMGAERALVAALSSDVVVAAIGPVCREALEAAGIRPRVVPSSPRIAALITALADYFSSATT
jgi:uroporphyrinogen-III synthase